MLQPDTNLHSHYKFGRVQTRQSKRLITTEIFFIFEEIIVTEQKE